jgi:glutathione synthase/RimK-type ligase-like ATP-grasp enzyme
MYLSQKHGHQNYITHEIRLVDSVPVLEAQHIEVGRDEDGLLTHSLGTKEQRQLTEFATVVNRLEPPVSETYLQQCRLLMFHPRVVNNPVTLQSHLEKFLPLYLGVGIPTSTGPLVAPRSGVSKPLHLFGGVGVEKVTSGMPVQELYQDFCPEIYAGEQRLLLVGDEIFGAINKVPQNGDFRSNSSFGSRMHFVKPSQEISHIASKIVPKLRQIGVWLAAIDFIGHRVVEVNITSPGLYFHLYHYMDVKDQARLEVALLAMLAAQKAQSPKDQVLLS